MDRDRFREPRTAATTRPLAWVSSAWLLIAFLGWTLLPEPWGGGADSRIAAVAIPVFFVLVALMLLGAVIAGPGRAARAVLLGGIVLWGTGAALFTAADPGQQELFPSPGEFYTLAAYLAFGLFLLADGRGGRRPGPVVWLEAAMVTGGSACAAGGLVLVPGLETGPVSARTLVTLLYPLLDLALAATVLVQVLRRRRRTDGRALTLALGFFLLGLADASTTSTLAPGVYERRASMEVVWGLAIWLLAVGASTAARPGAPVRAFLSSPLARWTALAGSLGAISMLFLSQTDPRTTFLAFPAAVTVMAGQARLWLALREARGASEARKLSLTDDLTGLPNRRALTEQLEAWFAEALPGSLLLLDLDGFKEVNDGLGHLAGDRLLQQAAGRIRGVAPVGVVVARVGGDEFALAVPGTDEAMLRELADSVLEVLKQGFVVDDVPLNIDGSVGIAVRRDDAPDGAELLRRADVAMYRAKTSQQPTRFYDRDEDDFSRERLELAEDLRRAIELTALTGPAEARDARGPGRIELWYQPQLDTAARAVTGVEALVRWRHPARGLVSPGDFLPLARSTGLMPRLSHEVVRQAVRDAADWADQGLPHRVSVNVAPAELLGGTVVPYLLRVLEGSALPAGSVVVEVTEDSFLADPQRAREVLETLHAHEVGVSVDDYGTGFSSLAYLRDLPVEELKIDRTFVKAVREDERSRMIVASTVRMAHALGMSVVGEGVEDAETADHLGELGVDHLQGFHLARPMPVEDVTRWLRERVPGDGPAVPRSRAAEHDAESRSLIERASAS